MDHFKGGADHDWPAPDGSSSFNVSARRNQLCQIVVNLTESAALCRQIGERTWPSIDMALDQVGPGRFEEP